VQNYNFDINYLSSYKYLAGTDEAGRGPLAGPVAAAAVILDLNNKITGLNDSKKLTEKKRDALYNDIIKNCISYAVSFISNEIIDEINIYQASKQAMLQAMEKLSILPEIILSDAMPFNYKNARVYPIIKGDTLSASIMSASIIAKVERDRFMIELDKKYPNYGFAKHKGYATKEHQAALNKYGPSDVHRKSFRLDYK
jgi:ribonuclease HII